MKRVLIVSSKGIAPATDFDGGSTALIEAIDSLLEAGWKCRLLLFRDKEAIPDARVDDVIFAPQKHDVNDRWRSRLERSASVAEAISVASVGCDVILVLHLSCAFGLERYPELFSRLVVVPLLCGLASRVVEAVPDAYIAAERLIIIGAREVVCSTEHEADFVRRYGVADDRVTVVPHAIRSISQTHELRTHWRAPIRLLYVAGVRKQKNHPDAIAVLRIVRDAGIDAELWLVGGYAANHDKVAALEAIDKQGVAGAVRWWGSVPHSQLLDIMRDADLAFSVSGIETFGLGLIEGLSKGLPTVVYNTLVSLREVATPSPGFVMVLPSPREVANQIVQWVTSTDRRLLAEAALSSVQQFAAANSERDLATVCERTLAEFASGQISIDS
jgi:glycosyltransferase involved in cell wall biosynthesis